MILFKTRKTLCLYVYTTNLWKNIFTHSKTYLFSGFDAYAFPDYSPIIS